MLRILIEHLGIFWTDVDSVLSLRLATVQEVLVTGNSIIWVVFLILDTIIAASIQLQ